jgi:hypothetical protein
MPIARETSAHMESSSSAIRTRAIEHSTLRQSFSGLNQQELYFEC